MASEDKIEGAGVEEVDGVGTPKAAGVFNGAGASEPDFDSKLKTDEWSDS